MNTPRQDSEQLSLNDQTRMLQALVFYPALTLIVTTRENVGYRLVTSPGAGITFLVMLFVAASCPRESRPIFLYIYTGFYLVGCVYQRLRRWWEFRKGIPAYSYSIGSTGFRRLPRLLPRFVARHRLIERFFEPLLFAGLGWFFFASVSTALGGWILFSSVCLLVTEAVVHQKEIAREMDMVDGMVVSEIQSENVERFSPPPGAVSHGSDDSAIPTGMSRDLQDRIRAKRKSK